MTTANERIRGAIYIPARAYNAYQMWNEYNPAVIERDLDYAVRLNLNALRVWLSYEYWLGNKRALEEAFHHFLSAADKRNIKVMPSLFEKVGVAPTPEALEDKNPLTAVCVHSPAREIYSNPDRWPETKTFVQWFMERFGSDGRLLAIEVMNEPIAERLPFARAMLQVAVDMKGTRPLTIGCINLEDNIYFLDIGIDVLQHHMNFPKTLEEAERYLKKLEETERVLGKPCWLTEWQRVRPVSSGWGSTPLAEGEWEPDYAPYAKLLQRYSVGTFFWSLMVKPAYLPPQRKKGTLNGVFHEDGSVWSLEDARAISSNPNFQAEEKKEWPEWCREIDEVYRKKTKGGLSA